MPSNPSLLNSNIEDNELLYRGIHPNNWSKEHDRASSAAYKDSNGASVDRDGARLEKDCVDFLLTRFAFKAVLKITAANVRAIGVLPIYKPDVPDNIYHTEIHDSANQVEIASQSKLKRLQKASEEVYVDRT